MADERVWLQHTDPDHTGYFHCPADAVADFGLLGWVVMDEPPPEPVSPVIAERLAWEAEQVRLAEEAAAAEKQASKSTKSAARGETEE